MESHIKFPDPGQDPTALYEELKALEPIAEKVRALIQELDKIQLPILQAMADDMPEERRRTNIDKVNQAITDLNDAHWGFLRLREALREA